jgi:hypothetical protein
VAGVPELLEPHAASVDATNKNKEEEKAREGARIPGV